MAWKNTNGNYSKERPHRVRLADGYTRTGDAITDELLTELGWSEFEEIYEDPIVPDSWRV
jgi:hypothetical protein